MKSQKNKNKFFKIVDKKERICKIVSFFWLQLIDHTIDQTNIIMHLKLRKVFY